MRSLALGLILPLTSAVSAQETDSSALTHDNIFSSDDSLSIFLLIDSLIELDRKNAGQLGQIRRIVLINLTLGLITAVIGASGRFWG